MIGLKTIFQTLQISMTEAVDNFNDGPFDLKRFISAQEGVYERVLSELKMGRKRTHWMWYIFPQIDGLGSSPTAKLYAIKSMEEAQAYLEHPVLGARLLECTETVLAIKEASADEIFGYPDNMKLKSCMTLFAVVSGPGYVFKHVIEKYFDGQRDEATLQILDAVPLG